MNNYENIIEAFRNGNVPASGVKSVCLGRKSEIEEFQYLLEQIDQGKSFARFLNGEYGAGKSFFLKVLEEMAFEEDFVVAWITISNNIPFNKIDVVYRNITKNLRCKTGTSLEHIIDRWLTSLKMIALNKSSYVSEQNRIMDENIRSDLKNVREHSNSFATAVENYHRLMKQEKYETANFAMAWIRGDPNIPFIEKRKFGVKGDISKENAINFLEALSTFVKSTGYSGLVILVDEVESIMNLHNSKLRDVAYNYLRDIYDNCNMGKFKNSLFVFAGTPQFYDDQKKGVYSFPPLYDRITNIWDNDYKDIRKPIITLNGFTEKNLIDISEKIMIIHSEVYKWNAKNKINPILKDIIKYIQEENIGLTGRKSIPRDFIKRFVSLLDIVQQDQSSFKDSQSILEILSKREVESKENFFEDDNW